MLHAEKIEQDRTVEVGIHADLAQTTADFIGDDIGRVGLDDSTIAAQHVQDKEVRNLGAPGEAAPLDPGEASLRELPAKLEQQPRFADAGLADHPNCATLAAFGLHQKIVEHRELAFAADKNRRSCNDRCVERGAAVRHTQ
jgi:hypothetical protein